MHFSIVVRFLAYSSSFRKTMLLTILLTHFDKLINNFNFVKTVYFDDKCMDLFYMDPVICINNVDKNWSSDKND